MNKNSVNNDVSVTIAPVSPVIRSNFSFLGETKMVRMWTIMNEGFHVGLAVLFSYFDIDSHRGIVLLRNKRKKELAEFTRDLLGEEKMEAINDFAFSRWNSQEDQKIARHYSYLIDKMKIKEKKEGH
jgi:hypothetical protein